MFNDYKVSSSVESQVSTFTATQYPKLIEFLQEYYSYMETNDSPLSILYGIQDLLDTDTYDDVTPYAILALPLTATSTTVRVYQHAEFPLNDGLIKISDEVILYKRRHHIEENGVKYTEFTDCVRGYSFNDLSVEGELTPNVSTSPRDHLAGKNVWNQSFLYFGYFLEKIRSQYLTEFPANILQENFENLNVNTVSKRIKDFYLSKGTPSSISFYFKFLFQKEASIINFKDYLMAPSNAIYQNKSIVRLETLDGYPLGELVNKGAILLQGEFEFPVQTVENIFSFASQVFEVEIANSNNIVPTKLTKVTARPITDNGIIYLYVDSTYGFEREGVVRIKDSLYTYYNKGFNYFVIDESENPTLSVDLVGQYVYDVDTLATVRERDGTVRNDSYFLIYAGVSDFTVDNNSTFYQEGDLGFVSNIVDENSPLVTTWTFNDLLPVRLNENLIAGINTIYTDDESVYVYTTGLPWYELNQTILTSKNLSVTDARLVTKFPRQFEKTYEDNKISTEPNERVGLLRDGTYIKNWKSDERVIRGRLETVAIVDGGDNYNVNNPPVLEFEAPLVDSIGTFTHTAGTTIASQANTSYEVSVTNLAESITGFRITRGTSGEISDVSILEQFTGNGYTVGDTFAIKGSDIGGQSPADDITITVTSTWSGTQATGELVINGSVKEVYLIDGGSTYLNDNTVITVIKDPTDTVFTGDSFRDAVLKPVVVDGQITKVRIIDPGTGYTKQPTVLVTPQLPNALTAEIGLFVGGPIHNVNITNRGSNYRKNPEYNIKKGEGASGFLNIENGIITTASVITGGADYNSRPIVNIIDDSDTPGLGGQIIPTWDSVSKQIQALQVVNGGLNYDETSVSISIEESGSGAILLPEATYWTKVNNTNPLLSQYFDINTGGFYGTIKTTTDAGSTINYSVLGAPKQLQILNRENRTRSTVNFTNAAQHSPIIGWALDGAPIYGPYGYTNPLQVSAIKKMASGWKKLTTSAFPSERTATFADGGLINQYGIGEFAEDYVWTSTGADLDENNGRYCITPEFPNGVYAYFMTVSLTDKTQGFPYFIGPYYAGKIDTGFNITKFVDVESLSDVRRYNNADSTSATKPIDTGFFKISRTPSSVDAGLDAIKIVTPGTQYKVGDVVEFDNSGTGGDGAAAFVSVLRGANVSSVTKATYDYLEYVEDRGTFSVGDTIKTARGFSAEIHAIDANRKIFYLTSITGSIPVEGEQFYNESLTTNAALVTETAGEDISTPMIEQQPVTSLLNEFGGISSTTSYFGIDTFNGGSGNISDYTPGASGNKYIKIDNEIMRVVSTVGANKLIVDRGFNSSAVPHDNNALITRLDELEVFDSSLFSIGDVIQVDSEKMRIVDILVQKSTTDDVVATKIVDSSGTNGSTQYYLYYNTEIQSNTTVSDVFTITDGAITDIVVDETAGTELFFNNPTVSVSTNNTLLNGEVQDVVSGTNIVATTYNHILIVERGMFATVLADHTPRTQVQGLVFSNGLTSKYEEDRIVSKFNSSSNGLVLDDSVTVYASSKLSKTFEVNMKSGTSGGVATARLFDLDATNPNTLFSTSYPDGLVFYEGSTYRFNIDYTASGTQPVAISFYSGESDASQRKEYFDINIRRTFGSTGVTLNKLTSFSILPDDSDLTKVIMEVRNLTNNAVVEIPITIKPEPINGTYDVINSSSGFFEVYNESDPDPDSELFGNYNLNTVRYTTTSKNANGPISVVTLTSNGFNYNTLPNIDNISTENGTGAILEALSYSVGSIEAVESVNSGYGYNPDPTQRPTLNFPTITRLKNNFKVTDTVISDGGAGYLFTPRITVSGGGISDGSQDHARFSATIANELISEISIEYPGYKYSSAPTINIEKYYYISAISGTDILFNINFKQYFIEGDAFKVRAYYFNTQDDEANGIYSYIESTTFYAYLGNVSLKGRASGDVVDLQILDNQYWLRSDGTTGAIGDLAGKNGIYYEAIVLARTATVTSIIEKSPFAPGEKVIIQRNDVSNNLVPVGFGFVASIKGWQPNNSVLRIENPNVKVELDDIVYGVNTKSVGTVDELFIVKTSAELGAVVQTPKQFLTTDSFLGANALKIQDSKKYQKFAYEVSVGVPSETWRTNYENSLHPAGHKLFSKTEVLGSNLGQITKLNSSIAAVGTTAAEEVSTRKKYNYLVTKNNGFDRVNVANKLLTDVLNIKTSIVGVFEDISDQFDGVETLFELKVVDPITPVVNGQTNYISGYEPDQMVVMLDNIVQTYGTSWELIDADKVIKFTSQRNAGEPMPDGIKMSYRQFNDNSVIYSFNTEVTGATDTFTLIDNDSNLFPTGIFSSIDENNWIVFVDGILQENSAFTLQLDGGTTPQITFATTLPVDTHVSVRYSQDFTKNEFTSGSVTTGTPVVLANKPTVASKHDYFVFVEGVLLETDDYDLDSSFDIIFNYDFSYDSLQVVVDSQGVSLNELSHLLSTTKYDYKIEDGQLEIPTGYTIKPEQYLVDISGVVQTPHVVYDTSTSGIRKIRFSEAPERYIFSDVLGDRSEVGRQFIGLLYTRNDPTGVSTTPNYQFEDVSQNLLHVAANPENFVVGDYITTSTSSAVIADKVTTTSRLLVTNGVTNTAITAGSTFDITVTSATRAFVGDLVKFNAAFGMTSSANDELQISAVNYNTNVITIENISASTVTINININASIDFIHYELILNQIETTAPDRDDAFQNGDLPLSGIISSPRTGTVTTLNEPYGVLETDTEITVTDGSIFAQNDYAVIDDVEVVKITNIATNVLTVERGTLTTLIKTHGDNRSIEKITPYDLEVVSFRRGFDGQKTTFELKENKTNINIGSDKDIFVIINGILQKKGADESYLINLVDPDGTPDSGDEYSVLTFSEAPPENAPFNAFYLGELQKIKTMAPLFNGSDRAFNLINPTNDEVFSLIAKSRSGANISANLIIFIDGSLQIPSTQESGRVAAYPQSLVSYKLFGSVVEFTSPPKEGSDFEGYIYVGSDEDYEVIDVDPSVERGDVIEQDNERAPRNVNLVLSSDLLSVGSSFGKVNPNPNVGFVLNDGDTGWNLTNLYQSQDIRETLRVRRTLKSPILSVNGNSFPLTGKTRYTLPVSSIVLQNISDALPTETDANSFSIINLAANSSFPERHLNTTYSNFAARSSLQTTTYGFDSSTNISGTLVYLADNTDSFESHSLTSGSTVVYDNNGNSDLTGLTNGETYYVSKNDQWSVILYPTLADYIASTNAISVTATGGSETHNLIGADVDLISNALVGYDLPFNQIIQLDLSAANETFQTLNEVEFEKVGSLIIVDAGTNFPNGTTNNVQVQVKDQNGNVLNNSATANVTVTFGVVSEVEVVNQGSGYLDSQEVFLNGFPGVKLQVSVINPTITYDTTRTATVINYTAGETVDGSASTVRYLYVQLDDPANPITTSTPITTSRGITHNVTTDDLINDYQQINVGDEFEYNF